MKKHLLWIALALGTIWNVSAQEKKVAFGVRAGLNLSNINAKYTGASDEEEGLDMKNRAGFHLGVVMDWNVAQNFYIQPGLYFTTRGAKSESTDDDDDDWSYTEKWNANYLQIPILASYRIPLSEKVKLGIDFGPYFALGLGGKVKCEENYDGDTEKQDFKIFGSGDDENHGVMKRFDAGLRFGVGVHVRKFYAGINYDLGLTNAAQSDVWGEGMKLHTRNFAVSVGVTF